MHSVETEGGAAEIAGEGERATGRTDLLDDTPDSATTCCGHTPSRRRSIRAPKFLIAIRPISYSTRCSIIGGAIGSTSLVRPMIRSRWWRERIRPEPRNSCAISPSRGGATGMPDPCRPIWMPTLTSISERTFVSSAVGTTASGDRATPKATSPISKRWPRTSNAASRRVSTSRGCGTRRTPRRCPSCDPDRSISANTGDARFGSAPRGTSKVDRSPTRLKSITRDAAKPTARSWAGSQLRLSACSRPSSTGSSPNTTRSSGERR